MLRLANICSLTEFRQNSKSFIDQMRNSGAPLVLTVNGRADVVLYECEAFQDYLDEMADTKEEVQRLKDKIEQLQTELAEAKTQISKSAKRSA
jgi:PHD/YefM family antitoxin component YafN of YafNO toxin-antitoxin module